MSIVRKTITLTQAQNEWIKGQINSGSFTNDSEVMRDLIRKAQQEDSQIAATRAALVRGEKSGLSIRNPEEIRAAVNKRKPQNG